MKSRAIGGLLSAGLLLASCTAPSQTVSRLSHTPLHGAKRLLSPAPHNFRRAESVLSDPVRRGAMAERFELRHGDCGGSDCKNPRARAEIQMRSEIKTDDLGNDIWYGWSFYNQSVPSFTKQNSLRLVFGQWGAGGKTKPVIRLIQLGKGEGDFDACDPAICDAKNTLSGDLVVQLRDMAAFHDWGKAQNEGYVCRLFDIEATKGRWVDISMNTNFAATSDGYLKIWVDGRLACDYSGPVVSPETMIERRPIKHRRGIFASWTKRWEAAEAGKPHPNLVVYYDEFRTGLRQIDVAVDVRAARNRPPVD